MQNAMKMSHPLGRTNVLSKFHGNLLITFKYLSCILGNIGLMVRSWGHQDIRMHLVDYESTGKFLTIFHVWDAVS